MAEDDDDTKPNVNAPLAGVRKSVVVNLAYQTWSQFHPQTHKPVCKPKAKFYK